MVAAASGICRKSMKFNQTANLLPRALAISAIVGWCVSFGAEISEADKAAAAWKEELAQRSTWWSLQAPKPAEPPSIADAAEPVDRFIRAKLAESDLSPAENAEPGVLLRRLSFVLTGLPPKSGQIAPFRQAYAQNADAAVANLADELLASPHFGERFARHWMDVVRYTDTYGYEWDIAAKGSWEYRDYLIRAFNGDIGFDQLIREQIAGDLLAKPRINREAGVNESPIGPMFYHMGEHRHGNSMQFNGIHQEMIDNKIDAFSKAFLAMTVACARCHDHKLDAISQADYYALAGVFMTPRWTSRTIDAPGKHDRQIAELKRLRAAIWGEIARLALERASEIRKWARENPPNLETWRKTAENVKNRSQTQVLSEKWPPGWVVEGDGLKHGFVEHGTPRVSLEGSEAVAEILPRGFHTHALSSKLPGAIRLPARDAFPKSRVSLKLAGGGWAARRDVPQNAFLNEGGGGLAFFDPAKPPTWVTLGPVGLKHGVTRVLTEISTAGLNPNFPPRTGLAKMGKKTLPHEDGGFDKRSWFSLTGIVSHDSASVPKEIVGADTFAGLYRKPVPNSAAEASQRLAEWLIAAVERWATGTSNSGDARILNRLLDEGVLPNSANLTPKLDSAVTRYRGIEATIAFPRSANSMDEREVRPIDYRLNLRGDVNDEGQPVRRDFLQVFAGKHDLRGSAGSGRLELARYLSSRVNPQTARVFVNRVWSWIFGTGIVATPSDFGKLGARPTHPELLDWLAIRFMDEGWSTKKLVRRLVLSQTFRQSGEVSSLAAERDPDNRLLHHYPTRRLEAEAIRDSLLAVSGRLDPRLFGRPIRPYRTAEDPAKRLFSGPLDGNGRRSIYLEMSIMQPPEFLVGFNLPDLKLPTGRRDVTNVPAQALTMLNDPFVFAMAQHWADELIRVGHESSEARIRVMFLAALGREPNPNELKRWAAAAGEDLADREAWADLAHTLFNGKEFIYHR